MCHQTQKHCVLEDEIQAVPADVRTACADGIPNPDKIPIVGLLRASQRTNNEWTIVSRRNKKKVQIRTTSG